MATKIVMPKMTDTMEEGILIKWYKKEGEKVEAGDRIAEIETDKAVMDLEAYGYGILKKILIGEQSRVPVGKLIGIIAREDEDIEAILAADKEVKPKARVVEAGKTITEEIHSVKAMEAVKADKIEASPRARKIAEEAGIDITKASGTGPGGRITQKDVEAYISKPRKVASIGVDYEEEELSLIRKTIARRMTSSKAPVPHFYLSSTIDMGNVLKLKEELGQDGIKVSITDIIIKAAATALKRNAKINASFMGELVRYYKRINIGIAVSLEDGLISPVIRDADLKGLKEISDETKDLVSRARTKSLRPDEYEGGSITISNLGMFLIENFIAVITPPEAAVIAVGSIIDEPVVAGGVVSSAKRMKVTMSFDHRVIDGVQGARFLIDLKGCLEYPARMIE
ncbi:MAG TPA: dihydrolipoamide acetyltransferase family protein [Nitrospiria bacterium]|nr:dihydrolipoamide acetyltransferase family protein [Nitrospiria bacterium]